MTRPTWNEITAAISTACAPYGVEWHEIRRAVVDYHLEENPWPEGEGLGGSDMNHILVGEWTSDETRVRQEIVRVFEVKQLEADLKARGVDLDALARLFAPR